jgi:predicted RNase H-like HicB family nuclease
VKYTIVIEKAPNNYAAYAPDLPGCVATGATRDEVVQQMREAIEFHLEELRRHGDPVPPPQTTAAQVDVAA